MKTRLTTTSLLTAALLALVINTSAMAQSTGGLFSGRITGLTNGGSDAGAANGLSAAVAFEPLVESLSPNRACTAMNFAVQVDAAPGNSRWRTFSLVINGVRSDVISCRVSGPTNVSCNSGSATQLVPARATLAITETTGAGDVSVTGSAAAFGWECNASSIAPPVATATVAPPAVTALAESVGDYAAEVAQCKNLLRSGTISWGGSTTWGAVNIDRLCNSTRNAANTISCFKSNVEALGWTAAIERCR
jgi:hypothetical protein